LPTEDVLKTRVVIDPLGIQELTARHTSLNEDGSEQATSRVKGGTKPGGSRAYDDKVQFVPVVHTCSNEMLASPALSKI
jgi:hypothetical protein